VPLVQRTTREVHVFSDSARPAPEVPRPITAYIALLAVALFLLGVFLLPHRERSPYRELSDGSNAIVRAR